MDLNKRLKFLEWLMENCHIIYCAEDLREVEHLPNHDNSREDLEKEFLKWLETQSPEEQNGFRKESTNG